MKLTPREEVLSDVPFYLMHSEALLKQLVTKLLDERDELNKQLTEIKEAINRVPGGGSSRMTAVKRAVYFLTDYEPILGGSPSPLDKLKHEAVLKTINELERLISETHN